MTARVRTRSLGAAIGLAAAGSIAVPMVLAGGARPAGAPVAPPAASLASGKHCFGIYPGTAAYGHQLYYAPGCQGHDEPEVNPISATAGTAQNITWTFVLPTDGTGTGARTVVDEGPTFWTGALVSDSHSLASQAFEELQFYPDSTLTAGGCGSDGSFTVSSTPNKYTACSPAWAVNPSTFVEYAAFNGMLHAPGSSVNPLVMNAGDTITVHYFKGVQTGTPFNITVTDTSTGQANTIVLSGGVDGTLAPGASANTTANYLQWGAVQSTPLALSWEIGHSNFYKYPLSPYCLPGMFNCFSYNDNKGWLKMSPIQIKSAQFNNASVNPTSWGVNDGQGGSEQDVVFCGKYNANASCTFPFYTYNGTDTAVLFGGNYSGTTDLYNQYKQFQTTQGCVGSMFGQPLYCETTLSPTPPIP